MTEYDLYLPLSHNDGTPVPASVVERTKALLVKRFGGVTDFRHRNEGLWKVGNSTYRDEILILRVLAENAVAAREIFATLKRDLALELRQREILVVERDVKIL